MLKNNDQIWLGALIGLLVPALAFFLISNSNELISSLINRSFNWQERTVAIMAICCNMIPMGSFRRNYLNKSLRGLIMITMALTIAWFFMYGRALTGG